MKQGYNGRTNYLTGNVLSDEWYTPVDVVSFIKNNIGIGSKKVICPFDSAKSNFVKFFPNSIYGIRDFMERDYEYDICITNPPFSFKFDILERILSRGKDCILVFPETAVFSVTFFNLLHKYNFHYKIYSPKQRIYFIDEHGNQNRPNFHSIILHIGADMVRNEIVHVDLEKEFEKELD